MQIDLPNLKYINSQGGNFYYVPMVTLIGRIMNYFHLKCRYPQSS